MVILALAALALLLLIGLLGKRDPPKSAPEKGRRAYVFGVNYGNDNVNDEEGCWKDVGEYAELLRSSSVFHPHEVFLCMNNRMEGSHYTSKTGMQKLLTKATRRDVDLVYVHFCGRGRNGIETSDSDVVTGDWLVDWATSFDPSVKVVATFDCDFVTELPDAHERRVTFVAGESITHALLDALQNNPRVLNDTKELCMHVSGYVGASPSVTATHDIAGDAFLPARADP